MKRVKLVRMEDGNGREWWQIAICGPWWWPTRRWAKRLKVVEINGIEIPVGIEVATYTTREEADAGVRSCLDRIRSKAVRIVETQRVGE